VKGTLQLRRLARSLSAEEVHCWVGGDDGSRVSAEQIARVLRRENQTAVVFADASGQGNHEAPYSGVVEKQAQLVNHEKPAPIAVLDPRPQGLGKQVVDGSNHLGPELAHAECDQRSVQVDIGWTAEDLSQTTLDPPAQHPTDPGFPWQPGDHVRKYRLWGRQEGPAYRELEPGTIGLVQLATEH